jgi:hypothetical protein
MQKGNISYTYLAGVFHRDDGGSAAAKRGALTIVLGFSLAQSPG